MVHITERERIPTAGDTITLTMAGDFAIAFVGLLNMNKIRNAQGHLLTFRLVPSGDSWLIEETLWVDR